MPCSFQISFTARDRAEIAATIKALQVLFESDAQIDLVTPLLDDQKKNLVGSMTFMEYEHVADRVDMEFESST